MAEQQPLSGPDLEHEGVGADELGEGQMILGRAGDQPVVIARTGGEVFAVGGRCTHYGGPLGKGLFDGEMVRCPWHHACFSVRTGEAVRAPAMNPVPTYRVREEGDRLYVSGPVEIEPEAKTPETAPASVVILGAGAAGAGAAETLRREGYRGPITMVGADGAGPVDRPNLSKDYLAGTAPEEWIPLRSEAFYAEHDIELVLGRRAVSIDPEAGTVTLDDGTELGFDALLIATGADPIHLDTPGIDLPHVHYLRTLDDSRGIIAAAEQARSAVVLGASFIGLEVAASLRQRDLEVHVVAPEAVLMERVLGAELGEFIRNLHTEHGVHFHLERTAAAIEEDSVTLSDGTNLAAQLVVVGVGVRPALALAEQAGLDVDRGIVVDEQLRTSAPGIWAAGDVARYPEPRLGRGVRVEHWVVAQRQGQVAARNMLGRPTPFVDVPFFWSQHYDVPINYVGHAEDYDDTVIDGSIADRNAIVAYRKDGEVVAVASIYRDVESLEAELALERGDQEALARLAGA